jgi:hypothetical protein
VVRVASMLSEASACWLSRSSSRKGSLRISIVSTSAASLLRLSSRRWTAPTICGACHRFLLPPVAGCCKRRHPDS